MRRLLLTSLSALATAGVLAASLSGALAASRWGGLNPDAALVVTSMTPWRNQETLPDLADPGLNNQIRVRFSTIPRARDLLDDTNLVNGLSRKCAFLDQAFAPVPAGAFLNRNNLVIDPFSVQQPVLSQGIYYLRLKSSIRSVRGRRLNDGRADFNTRFSVGTVGYHVVLLGVAPDDEQDDVGLRRTVVASFDVPLDLATALGSVRLENRSTTPATPIDALVTLEREGRDVVLLPSHPGLPPNAEIALVVRGRGTATEGTVLKSVTGVEFTRDWGPRWTADPEVPTLFHSELGDSDDLTGEFTATFRTRSDPNR